MQIQYPWDFDARGRTATSSEARHIFEMVEQLLMTSPGERVNRPDFGGGALQLVFAPNSDQLAAALPVNLQASIQRWLGDILALEKLEVSHDDSTLLVDLIYTVLRTGEQRRETIARRNVS
ncbi:MAG: GPW/gp25 family protein [Pirellulales bacterium]|nr:GPW/gp25 family protein [Pirellulales bacterium]